jgi:hypothetical protein
LDSLLGGLALVMLIASAVASTVALTQGTQTMHYVNNLAKNTSLALNIQENINGKIETRLDVLESAVTMIGDEVQALKARASLGCLASFRWICVTSKPYNDCHRDWECTKHHLQGVQSHTDLRINLMALHKEILDIQNSKLPIVHPGEVAG